MAIKIYGNHFENCGTGISAPKDADLDIGANQFVACGRAIDLRDPPTLLQALGLREETPLPLVREVFAYVSSSQRSDPEVRSKAESIGLLKWLSAGADASTLISAIASMYPYVTAILAALPK